MDNKELIKKYPFLLPRNVFTGKPQEDYDYSYNELEVSIPDGWWKAFGLAWCEDFKNCLVEAGINPEKIMIMQAKEKYGQLRVYLSGCPKTWTEHEFAWEYISEHTCIFCGRFPVPMRDDGWQSPYCDDCFKKQHPDSPQEKIDNWTIDDPFNGRLYEFLTYRTYENDDITEHYIDMKPYYEKIGWNYHPEDLVSLGELKAYKAEMEIERLDGSEDDSLNETK